MSQFQTFKSDLTHSRIVDTDSVFIHDGEIAVKIESFAFTANNVTYGVAGDTIGYWKFFPAAQDEKNEWGCIPMWGFAEITHSNIEDLNVGDEIKAWVPAGLPDESLDGTDTQLTEWRFYQLDTQSGSAQNVVVSDVVYNFASGYYSINNGEIKATGTHPLWVFDSEIEKYHFKNVENILPGDMIIKWDDFFVDFLRLL